MAFPKRFAHSLLVLPLFLAGCLSNVVDTATAESPDVEATSSGLPPGDFIAFFDGKNKAAAPYEIVDGMVVVDGDIVLGGASELLGSADGDTGSGSALAKVSGNIEVAAMAGQAKHWLSGRIPYTIETDAGRKTKILAAIRDWNNKAAVIWVPKTTKDVDYVAFVDNPSVTNSSVGRVGNRQLINVQPEASKPAVMHEMGHASGLWHEHQRSDRASNVNLSSTFLYNFTTNTDFGEIGTAVGAYDHNSLMHYGEGKYYFVWNAAKGKWEITNTQTENWIWLESQAGKPPVPIALLKDTTLSIGDMQTLRSMYMTALPYDNATSQSVTTGLGWPIVKPFKSGSANYILHYNTADGQFRTYPFTEASGMINNPVEWGSWDAGWTLMEYYTIGTQTYLLMYSRTSGSVLYFTVNANGKMGSWIWGQNWGAGWDIVRIYKPFGSNLPYLFRYSKASGAAQIWGMKNDGLVDLDRNTYSQTLFGYEDFQVMQDAPSELLRADGKTVSFTATLLLYHDQHSSTQFLQVLDAAGKTGEWVTTSGVGTGYTQVNTYSRQGRSQAMYYNKATGKLMICDIKPFFKQPNAGSSTTVLTAAPISAMRSHTTGTNFQVHNFNIKPWGNGADPKGAERLFLFDPNLKRFWNSNLVPYPSI